MKDLLRTIFKNIQAGNISENEGLGLIKIIKESSTKKRSTAQLNPLLHENTSILEEQKFTSTFTGSEFFLRDHLIKGNKVLPGVAYIEMARAALDKSTGKEKKTITLENIMWARPFIVHKEAKQIHIGLDPREEGDIFFEIYGQSEHEGEDEIIYSQGKGTIAPRTEKKEQLDIEAIKQECSSHIIEARECYDLYEKMGNRYGTGHRTVRKLYLGKGRTLARLELADDVRGEAEDFYLHPGMMDGALQSGIGLMYSAGKGIEIKPALPFALDSIEIVDRSRENMWAYVRYAEGYTKESSIQKVDIDICDEKGFVHVKLRGFTSRELESTSVQKSTPKNIKTLLFGSAWQNRPVDASSRESHYEKHTAILCGLEQEISGGTGIDCIKLKSDEKNAGTRYEHYAVGVFEALKKIIQAKPEGDVLIQVVTGTSLEQGVYRGLSALLKTAGLENPHLKGQCIQVEDNQDILAVLTENSRVPADEDIRYQTGSRQVLVMEELGTPEDKKGELPWKEEGVYLITGGLGGLGLLFAREIGKQVKRAKVILTGRSFLTESKRKLVQELEELGLEVVYKMVNVTDRSGVDRLIQEITAQQGTLNGIIHSAGIIRDNFIIKKSTAEYREVIAPKVHGLVNLDECTKEVDLDFMILFSSFAGVMGNMGQADYSCANGFMDRFAEYRNELAAKNERSGKTVSMNWPLWKEGGMKIDETLNEMMEEESGMVALPTEKGIRALYASIGLKQNHVMVIEGDTNKVGKLFVKEQVKKTEKEKPLKKDVLTIDDELVREKTVTFLKKELSEILKLAANRIKEDDDFETYGMDSVMVMKLTNKLEKIFGSLSKTLFFEYHNLNDLTGYFMKNYQDKLVELLGLTGKKPAQKAAAAEKETLQVDAPLLRRKTDYKGSHYHKVSTGPLDIAIVGLSGKYPESDTIDAYWENLQNGKDCIREVPKDRWNWEEYLSDDRSQKGCHFSKYGGFISDVDKFDPLFFGIAPREAVKMDPQERIFLEHAWHALEDAGYTRKSMRKSRAAKQAGQIGVYAGVMYGEYQLFGAELSLSGERTGFAGSLASIANRVSYYLNVHGPSMTVDSMCSSSLTAVHLACQDLKQGRTCVGIAGGVNVTIHPNKYLMLSSGQFISSKGHCESFGIGGDGYIPGEGVGVVILKRLEDAQKDNDHIYGVIKGSALNHGGKTNGYSVPNPAAQAEVIKLALEEAEVNARGISYVEAHGTGTVLGDPIEISGLSQSFSGDKQYCYLGSAKSNIGHCESAAGIAGLTKILLQMKHKKLVPSLHSKELNPHIDFTNSPFIVNQDLREWERPRVSEGGKEREYPRIAGLSSFGAGGSNAHMIIEEYAGAEKEVSGSFIHEETPALIVLSAKTGDQVKEVARKLLQNIEKGVYTAKELVNIAYTLQVGREDMDERLALVASSLEELQKKLTDYLEQKTGIDELYEGRVSSQGSEIAVYQKDDDFQQTVKAWIEKQKYSKLLELWVKGLQIEWDLLYQEDKPKKISLPLYPFEHQRYWIDTGNTTLAAGAKTGGKKLHPLLYENTSNLEKQRFTSTFTGSEYFLKDHLVKGQVILPGTAHLEMAAAAVNLSTTTGRICLQDVIWGNAFLLEKGPKDISISLMPGGRDYLDYMIYSGEGADETLYSQGKVKIDGTGTGEPGHIDINKVLSGFTDKKLKPEIYQGLKQLGFSYGPAFQMTAEIYGGQREAFSKLVLPENMRAELDSYMIHPSLLDAAFRTTIEIDTGEPDELRIPFSVGQVTIYSPIPQVCYCHATISSIGKDGKVSTNVSIYNEAGEEVVAVKDLTGKPYHPKKQEEVLYYKQEWKEADLTEENPSGNDDLIVVFDTNYRRVEEFRKQRSEGTVIHVTAGEDFKQISELEYSIDVTKPENYLQLFTTLASQKQVPAALVYLFSQGTEQKEQNNHLKDHLYNLLYIFQALTKQQLEKQTALLYCFDIADTFSFALHEAVTGFAKALTVINHLFTITSVQVDNNVQKEADLAAKLLKEISITGKITGLEIKYQNRKRYKRSIEPCNIDEISQNQRVSIKERGVYLISGGAGGIGLIFTRYLVEHYKANIIILGRSPLNETKQKYIDDLKNSGSSIVYVRADVSNEKELTNALAEAKKDFDHIDGILHCAGIAGEIKATEATRRDFETILAPKVAGTINLDRVTKDEKLDFFMLFSSISSLVGDFGVASYAAANRFLDSFAYSREALRQEGTRSGYTLSINWPYWEQGGFGEDLDNDKAAQDIFDYSGMVPLKTDEGLNVFEEALNAALPQLIVFKGDRKKINKVLKIEEKVRGLSSPVQPAAEAAAPAKISSDKLFTKTEDYLKGKLSEVTGIGKDKIDSQAELEHYGIDSVMIMELNRILGKDFDGLPGTLFFEYTTINDLTGYFLENQRDVLMDILQIKSDKMLAEPVKERTVTAREETRHTTRSRFAASLKPRVQSFTGAGVSRDVAIIGISGTYPGAKNVEEFWKNLEAGRDTITEVPPERWDLDRYYAPEKQPGKTYSKWGGFIEDVDKFDPLFFNIAPAHAETMDPQIRLLLEKAWTAVEDAGYTRQTLTKDEKRNVAVYVGSMWNEYQLLGGTGQALSSNTSALANHISYHLNIHGPSLVIDTACSSSLIALSMAYDSISKGEVNEALAAGVNLSIHPNKYINLCQDSFFSTDGRCRSFGKGGDGYVSGEGVGCIFLKSLESAVEDNDHIYGVIKGCAVNHGGKTNGFTVPNPNAQEEVILMAMEKAGVDPEHISYVEAHGTGTQLGDPIEIRALTKAYRKKTEKKEYCAIGSVKSNVGHLEGAAGVVAVSKVLMQLKHKKIVPSLHSKELNPIIDFKNSPFKVQQELTDWERPKKSVDGKEKEYPRLAGISSFGAGGANAHVIIEEYVPAQEPPVTISEENPALIVLSARSPEKLKEQARNLLTFMQGPDYEEHTLANIAYTLQVGREAMEERLALIVTSGPDLQQKLKDYGEGKTNIDRLFTGCIKQNQEILALFKKNEDLEQVTLSWVEKNKYDQLLDFWVKGLEIDWNLFYTTSKPVKISLPGYPFARERYWIEESPLSEDRPEEGQERSFNQGFYEDMIEKIMTDEIDIDEAILKI